MSHNSFTETVQIEFWLGPIHTQLDLADLNPLAADVARSTPALTIRSINADVLSMSSPSFHHKLTQHRNLLGSERPERAPPSYLAATMKPEHSLSNFKHGAAVMTAGQTIVLREHMALDSDLAAISAAFSGLCDQQLPQVSEDRTHKEAPHTRRALSQAPSDAECIRSWTQRVLKAAVSLDLLPAVDIICKALAKDPLSDAAAAETWLRQAMAAEIRLRKHQHLLEAAAAAAGVSQQQQQQLFARVELWERLPPEVESEGQGSTAPPERKLRLAYVLRKDELAEASPYFRAQLSSEVEVTFSPPSPSPRHLHLSSSALLSRWKCGSDQRRRNTVQF